MMLVETKVDRVFKLKMDEYRKLDNSKSLLENCRDNIVVFCEKMLGISLYSWQIDFLTRISKAIEGNYWTKEFLALTSRQIGKTIDIAILAAWVTVFNKYTGESDKNIHNNTTVGIISASDKQAKKVLREIRKLLINGDKFVASEYLDDTGKPIMGKKFFTSLLDESEANNTTTITFKPYDENKHKGKVLIGSKSGSTIDSYPPTALILGETFSVLIEDEAGKTERITDEFHYDYAYPTGNTTNAIRIYTSTPWVPSGFFYRLADPQGDYNEHTADRILYTIDAIKLENPTYYKSIMKTIKQLNKEGKTDEVQRAYYCRFVKGEQSYFNPEKVFTIFTDEYSMMSMFSGECDLGIDFGGQVTSKTVITITTLGNDKVVRRLYHKSYEVGKDLSLLSDVESLLKVFNVQRIIPDECPAGDFLIKKMVEKGWNVHPMNFRKDKVKKYGAFRASLNRNEIQSYIDDDLKTEMLAMEFSQGTRQSIIQHAPNYTDDLIDSFIMSAYFYVQEEEGFKYYDMDDEEYDTEES